MASTDSETFFDEQTPQSQVKSEIVEKYFSTWAQIIIATQKQLSRGSKIGYIDLFAGPGRYEKGAISTPLKVLSTAISKPDLADRLLAIFNDKDESNARTLQTAIRQLPGVANLKHEPKVWNEEVGDKIAESFESINTIPLLAFIDPWGYKGLTLRLVNAFLKNWGCDCIFFFNYSRINAGLSNPLVAEHMAALFGEDRAERLRAELEPMTPPERESTIVNELATALREHSADEKPRFVLPFCFKKAGGRRTTHHLILVTKHFKGYEVMKEIMAKASSEQIDGVASFHYSPSTNPSQLLLAGLNQPLTALKNSLLRSFAGQTLTMRAIYEQHSVDTPYIAKNYKDVLCELEAEGAVTVFDRKSNRGFADQLRVQFPG